MSDLRGRALYIEVTFSVILLCTWYSLTVLFRRDKECYCLPIRHFPISIPRSGHRIRPLLITIYSPSVYLWGSLCVIDVEANNTNNNNNHHNDDDDDNHDDDDDDDDDDEKRRR